MKNVLLGAVVVASAMVGVIALALAAAGPVDIEDVLHPPRGVQAPVALTSHATTAADYPTESVAAHEMGTMTCRYLVLEDGTVAEVQLVRSTQFPRLDDAGVALIRKWRFSPAKQNGKAVRAWLTTTIVWNFG